MSESNSFYSFDTVRSRIKELRRTNIEGRWFIAESSVADCLPRQVLKGLLAKIIEPWGVKQAVDAIENCGRKVFTILILIKEQRHIMSFLESQSSTHPNTILDSQIPFSISALQGFLPSDVAREFEEEQWDLVVPVIRKQLFHQRFEPRVRLPFIESLKLGDGGFGNVFEIVVSAGCHDLEGINSSKSIRIVRKELKGDDAWEKIGRNEQTINAYLQHLDHPSILPLLTTYTQHGATSFLFPLAQEGDLEAFLLSPRRPEAFLGYSAFYEALHGLASALESLHGFKLEDLDVKLIGYHHDINPRNVLVQGKRFILADFGLSKLTEGSNSKTPFKIGRGHYLAPECEDHDAGFKKGIIGRSGDVWSLGCIMLEVIVSMVGGADSVTQFRLRRKFQHNNNITRTFFCGKFVNPEVTNEIDNLSATQESIPLKKALLLIRQIITIDPETRPKASEVTARLRLISLEHSYLKMCGAIRQLGDEERAPEIVAELSRFTNSTKNFGFGNNKVTFDPTDLVNFKELIQGSDSDTLVASIEELRKKVASVGSQETFGTSVASDLRKLNETLTTLWARSTNEATNSDDAHATPTLRYYDHMWRGHCYYVCVSEEGGLVASQQGSHIQVFDIRTGDSVRTIACSTFPSPEYMRFTPDGRHLLVVSKGTRRPELVAFRLKGEGEASRRLCRLDPGADQQIRLVAITPDSSKVAIVYEANTLVGPCDLAVLKGPSSSEESPTSLPRIRCSGGDCIFSFSPDGKRLAFSSSRTKFQDGRHIIEIRVLDLRPIARDENIELVVLESSEKFCDRTWYAAFKTRNFEAGMYHWPFYSHLLFRQLDGTWVAGIWSGAERTVTFWSIYSKAKVSTSSLSCFNDDKNQTTDTAFCGSISGTRVVPVRDRSWRLFGQGAKEQASTIAFANIYTNQLLVKLEGEAVTNYRFSDTGRYVVTSQRLKNYDHQLEYRVFDLGKYST
ncbi:kinase-like domain-containing protein [Xylaria castorea]|nr:kinase-like domain-containing protein [Xylaria castorea]